MEMPPSYKIGDLVRIRTPEEVRADGYEVTTPCAIDAWKNQICKVESVVSSAFIINHVISNGYKLSSDSEPITEYMKEYYLTDYVWAEHHLDSLMKVETDSFETLLTM